MRRPLLVSALAYAAFAVALGRDVLAQLGSAIAADRGDPILNAAILTWNARHIPWTTAWYDFPGFHPATGMLTLSEHLLGLSVLHAPLYWVSGNAIAAYNLTLLASYLLCGMAMFVLIWRLTGHAAASFVAGFAYAFAPYKMSQIAHIQMLATFWAPLALLGLHEFVRAKLPRARVQWLALSAVSWMMQGAANGYLLVFFSVLVGLWILWFIAAQARWADLGWVILALVIASLPLAPILLRYQDVHAFHLLARSSTEVLGFSADVTSIGCAVPRLVLWGWLSAGICGGEREMFPGITLLAILAVAAVASWRPGTAASRTRALAQAASLVAFAIGLALLVSALIVARSGPWRLELGPIAASSSSVAPSFLRGMILLIVAGALSPALWSAIRAARVPAFYLLAAAIMWALSWGPEPALYGERALEHGPYSWLMLVPGLDALRVPARFWMMAVLCVCVAAGVLLAAALERRQRGLTMAAAAICALGLAADTWATVPAAVPWSPLPRPELVGSGPVLRLPLGDGSERDAAAQFEAVVGGWRSINGYSGSAPRHYDLLRAASLQQAASIVSPFLPESDLTIVVERGSAHDAFAERLPGARLVAETAGVRQYRLAQQGLRARAQPAGMRLPIAAVTASCSESQASLVLDGDSLTRWECGPQREGQTIEVDLGSVAMVGDVVPAIAAFSTDFPRRLLVETSVDRVSWTTGWVGGVTAEAFAGLVDDPDIGRIVLPMPPRGARYVRLRLMTQDELWYWSVSELEVWSAR